MADRLISASALITEFIHKCAGDCTACPMKSSPDVCSPCGLIVNAPAIEAEPIVRCKDCKRSRKEEPGFVYCYNFSMPVRNDFYCGGGRPKDEVEE